VRWIGGTAEEGGLGGVASTAGFEALDYPLFLFDLRYELILVKFLQLLPLLYRLVEPG